MLTLIFLPKNLGEIQCMFDRSAPHLRLEGELYLCRPFGYRRKLEEITGDNDLSGFNGGEARGGR